MLHVTSAIICIMLALVSAELGWGGNFPEATQHLGRVMTVIFSVAGASFLALYATEGDE